MSLNATLLGQVVVFFFLVWFTMRYIWPPLMKALEDREQRIASGIAASDEGRRMLQEAQRQRTQIVEEGRRRSEEIIAQAQQRGARIEEEARRKAEEFSKYIVNEGRAEVARTRHVARQELSQRVSAFAMLGAERILRHEVNRERHAEMLNELTRKFSASPGNATPGTA